MRSAMVSCLLRLLASIFLTASTAVSIDLGGCRLPLGVTSGEIKDESMTASSSFDENNTGPQNGRVNVERSAGAWCPLPQVSRGTREYLEVALAEVHVVTAVLTQGRYDRGRGVEYTRAFTLEYWRADVGWRNYTRWDSERILPGNTNVASVKENSLIPPVVARRVRFLPYSQHSRTVCLRVELLGCRRTDGIVSYSMRQGDLYSQEINFRDLSFDGEFRRGFLSRGLGQLTDGYVGVDNFLADIGQGKGYEWVGWTNNASQQYPIEITFEFDAIRNFSQLSLHTNVHYSHGIQIFSLVRVFFSDGGKLYQSSAVISYPRAVRATHEAHNISVNLNGRTARFVKIQLFFSSKWILISEVQFTSGVCGNTCNDVVKEGMTIPHTEVWRARPQDISKIASMSGPDEPGGLSDGHLGLVVGLLMFVLLAVLLAVGLLYWRGRRLKSDSLTYTTFTGPFGDRKVTISTKGVSKKKPLAPLTNGLNEDKGSLFGRLDIAAGPAAQTLPGRAAGAPHLPQTSPRDVINGKGLVVNHLDASTFPAMKLKGGQRRDDRAMYQSESTSELSDSTTAEVRPSLSHTPPKYQYENLRSSPAASRDSVRVSPLPGRRLGTDTLEKQRRADPGGDPGGVSRKGYGSQLDSPLRGQVERFPASALQLQRRLGDGKYGDLLLYRVVDDRLPANTVVIAKCVNRNISPQLSDEFRDELAVASRMRCRHVCAVLGVSDEPAAILVQHSPLGDLNQFLQGHVSETSSGTGTGTVLSHGSLLYLATQISSGMSFLEDNCVVHKDLATRNCIVFHELQVKLTDTGSGRDLYAADYYQLDNRTRLPIRWLAWEALFMGQQSSASDAWSFAVTLWEILTFAREQPFENFSDESVISNLALFYNNDGGQLPPRAPATDDLRPAAGREYLPAPLSCSAEVYDLMLECWRRTSSERPRFRQIHLFLQRINLGYRPAESA